jgi:hypothetical protein
MYGLAKKIVFVATIISASQVFAAADTTIITPNQTGATKYYYCPSAAQLKLDPQKHVWSAVGGWKSYDVSFVQNVTQFIGAQWTGVNIGQLTCLYVGLPEGTFPIKLVSNHLFHFPYRITIKESNANGVITSTPSKWLHPASGYINCYSKSQLDCPLEPVVAKQQGNFYDEALQLKKDGIPAIDRGSAF